MSQPNIASFFGGGKASRVDKLIKTSSKEERRAAEKKLLKPDVLPPFTGSTANSPSIDNVRLYFKDKAVFKLFRKHFKVTDYVETSCYRLDLLIAFLNALEEGTLVYDEEHGRLISVNRKSGNRERSAAVGEGEPQHVRRTR